MESESQWRKKRETCGVRTIVLVPEHVRLILSRQKSKSGPAASVLTALGIPWQQLNAELGPPTRAQRGRSATPERVCCGN